MCSLMRCCVTRRWGKELLFLAFGRGSDGGILRGNMGRFLKAFFDNEWGGWGVFQVPMCLMLSSVQRRLGDSLKGYMFTCIKGVWGGFLGGV